MPKWVKYFFKLSRVAEGAKIGMNFVAWALMLADNRARPAFRTSVDLEEGMVLGPHLDPKSGSMVHMRLL